MNAKKLQSKAKKLIKLGETPERATELVEQRAAQRNARSLSKKIAAAEKFAGRLLRAQDAAGNKLLARLAAALGNAAELIAQFNAGSIVSPQSKAGSAEGDVEGKPRKRTFLQRMEEEEADEVETPVTTTTVALTAEQRKAAQKMGITDEKRLAEIASSMASRRAS